MKKLTVVLLVALLVLMAAMPAQAEKPVKGSADYEEDNLVVDCAGYGYGFEVRDYLVYHEGWTDFFDQDGNWIRTALRVKGVDHVYNGANANRFVEGHYELNCQIVPASEPNFLIVTCTGVDWNIQMPGYGTVYHQSGLNKRLVEWVDDHGEVRAQIKRAGLDKADFETLCEALQ